jgi:hypothetical protein
MSYPQSPFISVPNPLYDPTQDPANRSQHHRRNLSAPSSPYVAAATGYHNHNHNHMAHMSPYPHSAPMTPMVSPYGSPYPSPMASPGTTYITLGGPTGPYMTPAPTTITINQPTPAIPSPGMLTAPMNHSPAPFFSSSEYQWNCAAIKSQLKDCDDKIKEEEELCKLLISIIGDKTMTSGTAHHTVMKDLAESKQRLAEHRKKREAYEPWRRIYKFDDEDNC